MHMPPSIFTCRCNTPCVPNKSACIAPHHLYGTLLFFLLRFVSRESPCLISLCGPLKDTVAVVQVNFFPELYTIIDLPDNSSLDNEIAYINNGFSQTYIHIKMMVK